MMSLKQNLKSRDSNRNSQTPETTKKTEQKGSMKNRKKVPVDGFLKKDLDNEDNEGNSAPNAGLKRPISQENRALKKFSHTVYNKAALMLDRLIEAKGMPTEFLEFESEFERRRVYSLAFAAKRCKYSDMG